MIRRVVVLLALAGCAEPHARVALYHLPPATRLLDVTLLLDGKPDQNGVHRYVLAGPPAEPTRFVVLLPGGKHHLQAMVSASADDSHPLDTKGGSIDVPSGDDLVIDFAVAVADAGADLLTSFGDADIVTGWTRRTSLITQFHANGLWVSQNNLYVLSDTRLNASAIGNPDSWTTFAIPGFSNFNHIHGTDDTHLFIVTRDGNFLVYSGLDWTDTGTSTSEPLYGVWAVDSGDVWACGAQNILFWNNTGRATPRAGGDGNALLAISAVGLASLTAVGDNGTLVSTIMNVFQPATKLDASGARLLGAWSDPVSAATFVVGAHGFAAHRIGEGVWSMESNGGPSLNAVWGTSDSDVWAVGDLGTIAHYDGALWTFDSFDPQFNLTGVWGVNGHVYAVGWSLDGSYLFER